MTPERSKRLKEMEGPVVNPRLFRLPRPIMDRPQNEVWTFMGVWGSTWYIQGWRVK